MSDPRLAHEPQAPADLLLRDVQALDPREGIDARVDVRVRAGEVAQIATALTLSPDEAEEVIDADGRLLVPAFFDPHVHLRTPGQEHKEDLQSGTSAAA